MSSIKHWRFQRYSAMLLLPLGGWLFFQLMCLPSYQASDINEWLSSPLSTLLLLLTLSIGLYHGKLGVEVIGEDYISKESTRNGFLKGFNAVLMIIWGLITTALILTVIGG